MIFCSKEPNKLYNLKGTYVLWWYHNNDDYNTCTIRMRPIHNTYMSSMCKTYFPERHFEREKLWTQPSLYCQPTSVRFNLIKIIGFDRNRENSYIITRKRSNRQSELTSLNILSNFNRFIKNSIMCIFS